MLTWSVDTVPDELVPALRILSEHYAVMEGDSPNLVFRKSNSDGGMYCAVHRGDDGRFLIEYSSVAAAMRAAGSALCGLECRESTPFEKLGVMLDCSRNRVMKVEHIKFWLRCMALSGCNLLMLYTEDTYRLDGYPFFCLLRGAYSAEDIREIDDYAYALGIEVRGCIQTLGHMEQALKWPDMWSIRDMPDILLADEPGTYDLIEKMMEFWSGALRSRKIHVGMDETNGVGRGNFFDKHGQQAPFEIYGRHLSKVKDICLKYGLSPEIWSDMFFAYASSKKSHRDPDCEFSQDVVKCIPEGVKLWYWDYYHDDSSYYEKMIEKHRELWKGGLSMASGILTWDRAWCDTVNSRKINAACINACRKTNVEEVLFTMWGDNGGFCIPDSALPQLAYACELAFDTEEDEADECASVRVDALFGMNYDVFMSVGELDSPVEGGDGEPSVGVISMNLIWDDPFYALMQHGLLSESQTSLDRLIKKYRGISDVIRAYDNADNDLRLRTVDAFLDFLRRYILFGKEFRRSYKERDCEALSRLKDAALPDLIKCLERYADLYRKEWLSTSSAFGLDVWERRTGATFMRLHEAAIRIGEFLDGVRDGIEELDEINAYPIPPHTVRSVWNMYPSK